MNGSKNINKLGVGSARGAADATAAPASSPGILEGLKERVRERTAVKQAVCAVLAPALAQAIASAGIEGGELTVGVVGAAWASRLRYVTESLKLRVAESLGVRIDRVRIRVVPPPPQQDG